MVAGQTKQGNMTGAERPQTRKSRRKVRRVESYRESALAVVDRSLEDTPARSRALRRARACGRGRRLDRDDSEEVEVVAVAVPTGIPEDRDGFPRRLVGEPLYYISQFTGQGCFDRQLVRLGGFVCVLVVEAVKALRHLASTFLSCEGKSLATDAIDSLPSHVDTLVCTSPCTPLSPEGRQSGLSSGNADGGATLASNQDTSSTAWLASVSVVRKFPQISQVIMENVPGIRCCLNGGVPGLHLILGQFWRSCKMSSSAWRTICASSVPLAQFNGRAAPLQRERLFLVISKKLPTPETILFGDLRRDAGALGGCKGCEFCLSCWRWRRERGLIINTARSVVKPGYLPSLTGGAYGQLYFARPRLDAPPLTSPADAFIFDRQRWEFWKVDERDIFQLYVPEDDPKAFTFFKKEYNRMKGKDSDLGTVMANGVVPGHGAFVAQRFRERDAVDPVDPRGSLGLEDHVHWMSWDDMKDNPYPPCGIAGRDGVRAVRTSVYVSRVEVAPLEEALPFTLSGKPLMSAECPGASDKDVKTFSKLVNILNCARDQVDRKLIKMLASNKYRRFQFQRHQKKPGSDWDCVEDMDEELGFPRGALHVGAKLTMAYGNPAGDDPKLSKLPITIKVLRESSDRKSPGLWRKSDFDTWLLIGINHWTLAATVYCLDKPPSPDNTTMDLWLHVVLKEGQWKQLDSKQNCEAG